MDPDPAVGAIPLELPQPTVHAEPAFFLDLSGRGLPRCAMWGVPRHNHGTYLIEAGDCLLVAGNLLIERSGDWHCESIWYRSHIVAFYGSDTFDAVYPGPKPRLTVAEQEASVDLSDLTETDMVHLDRPVFLATATEPDNWGRWVVQVIPKIAYFLEAGRGAQLLCRAAKPWQVGLLRSLGVPDEALINHDPGRTHRCDRLMMHMHSSADGTVSLAERALIHQIGARCLASGPGAGKRIFVSRLGDAVKRPGYRVLQNEAQLIDALTPLGFVAIEPETMPFDDQVRAFHGADVVVGLGGAGMFNVAFCRPGTKVVTIEATDVFITGHTGMFSSLELPYGVILGQPDESDGDPGNPHRRWTLDVARAMAAIRDFV